MIENKIASFLDRLRESRLLRLMGLALIVLVLLIPISSIRSLVSERQMTRSEAVSEVTDKWGEAQRLAGPWIVVPYVRHRRVQRPDGSVEQHRDLHHARFLPENLVINGRVSSEVRKRGIYEIPLYTAELKIEGAFAAPDLSLWQVNADDILWDRAHLVLAVSDPPAIKSETHLSWAGATLPFEPATGDFSEERGIHVPLGESAHQGARFALNIHLQGSQELSFAPFGRTTTVTLAADWPHPSFQGGWLPSSRTVNASGFEARWQIPHLGRSHPQRHSSEAGGPPALEGNFFGVALISPIDAYRMSDRSVKYASLFLLLTFALIWVFELTSGRRVHAVQYLLTGAACCLFYVLQLSLAEHLGFEVAHGLASLAITVMIGAYSVITLGSRGRAAVVAATVAALYGYLFLVLKLEDYALVSGAVALFIALGAVMAATRRVRW